MPSLASQLQSADTDPAKIAVRKQINGEKYRNDIMGINISNYQWLLFPKWTLNLAALALQSG